PNARARSRARRLAPARARAPTPPATRWAIRGSAQPRPGAAPPAPHPGRRPRRRAGLDVPPRWRTARPAYGSAAAHPPIPVAQQWKHSRIFGGLLFLLGLLGFLPRLPTL